LLTARIALGKHHDANADAFEEIVAK